MSAMLRGFIPLLCLPMPFAFAGEIAGLPANLPPGRVPAIDFGFYNDFIGRGGSTDDFRTQQLLLTASLDERWSLTVDHSILTQKALPGRVDQLSASLGYTFIDRQDTDRSARVVAGTGFRSQGDFAGERIQNGFHQLIGGGLEFLPYEPGERDSATAWLDARHRRGVWHGLHGRAGYWLRGSALATTAGQFDASLGLYGTFETRHVEVWAGLRQDWRRGYDTPMMSAVADAEEDTAAVFGLRWGALVLETVQQFGNDASYGALRLVSTASARPSNGNDARQYAVDLGFQLPDVTLVAEGRWQPDRLNRRDGPWRTSLVARFAVGKPQVDGVNTLYVDSREINLGFDWERPLPMSTYPAAFYANAGLGFRSEQFFGEGALSGQTAASRSSALVQAGTGLRATLAESARRWRLRLQLGVNVSAPFDSGTVVIGGQPRKTLETAVSGRLSFTIEHR